MQNVVYSIANAGPVIVQTGFKNYDVCINPYVGCEFGCTYCYVRWYIKDPKQDWGEFLRLRQHIETKLPKELDKGLVKLKDWIEHTYQNDKKVKKIHYRYQPINESRLVIGTMTDPFTPAERKEKITHKLLEILVNHQHQFKKVGIFTRSPIVLDEIDTIIKLPNPRVHFTITPIDPDILHKIEPISPKTDRRWEVVRQLKQTGIKVHVNVAPVLPLISDQYVEEFTEKLVELKVDEFFVDPMMPYKESKIAFEEALKGTKHYEAITEIINDKVKYNEWKQNHAQRWIENWQKNGRKETLAILSDHEHKVWINMQTNESMSHRHYGEDAI